jgi:hypothetical protein
MKEVLIAVNTKITTVLWNVMLCSVKTVTKVLEEPAASVIRIQECKL